MAVAPADKGHSPFPSPERAIYGFVLYLATFTAAAVYVTWAVLPDKWLHFIGFSYFPQKYWAVAMPTYLCVGVVLFLACYVGVNLLLVADLCDPHTLTDEHSLPPPPPCSGVPPPLLPPLYDLPLSTVNSAMFPATHSHKLSSS